MSRVEGTGSIDGASAWLALVLGHRDLTLAWPATDPVVRLAIAQGWLFERGEKLTHNARAASLSAAPSHSPLWSEFEKGVLEALDDKWSFFDYDGRWGVLHPEQPGPGRDLEVVYFVVLEGAPDGPIEVEPGAPWATLPLLMRSTAAGWLVAGFSQSGPPEPGWPPNWPTGPKADA